MQLFYVSLVFNSTHFIPKNCFFFEINLWSITFGLIMIPWKRCQKMGLGQLYWLFWYHCWQAERNRKYSLLGFEFIMIGFLTRRFMYITFLKFEWSNWPSEWCCKFSPKLKGIGRRLYTCIPMCKGCTCAWYSYKLFSIDLDHVF